YTNKWAVEIEGGPEVARKLAEKHGYVCLGQVGTLENYYLFESRRFKKRSVRQSQHRLQALGRDPQIKWVEQQEGLRRYPRSFLPKKMKFSDPLWPNMWFMNRNGYTMNVVEAWKRGYTGEGVVIAVIDDGLEHNHTDLAANYNKEASYDVIDDDEDPMPDYKNKELRNHGTRCAGQIAAVANNKKCIVGVAFKATIGG
ncbi:hypothetical protein HELRODRAFT_149650, partial [Helobdella robusta]|uniref:Peptidase S8/S53 domain-containing protein n=1 Tax=Helobdella robusta TaxID=6412 RepID=T1EKD2_HELRO